MELLSQIKSEDFCGMDLKTIRNNMSGKLRVINDYWREVSVEIYGELCSDRERQKLLYYEVIPCSKSDNDGFLKTLVKIEFYNDNISLETLPIRIGSDRTISLLKGEPKYTKEYSINELINNYTNFKEGFFEIIARAIIKKT